MLDIGPTTPLSADVWHAKKNVRPKNKRAPTKEHLRLRQHAAEPDDVDDDDRCRVDDIVAVTDDKAPAAVSCRDVCVLLLCVFSGHTAAACDTVNSTGR